METNELTNAALLPCPKCGVMVSKLDKHLKKVHDPIKVANKQKKEQEQRSITVAKKNFEIIEKARHIFLMTQVQCSICLDKFSLNLLVDHYFKAHNSQLPADMRAIYGLAESKNLFKTTKEREDYWKKTSGVAPKGDDIFDRGMTVQGGAYGLGKNRKH